MIDSDWRAERRRIQRRLVDAEFQRLAAQARVNELEQALKAAEARAAQAEQDLTALQGETAALRSSTSWRITQPLRAASLALGKGRYSVQRT